MKKDVAKGVRVNGEVMKALEKEGWTAQKLIDWAIDRKVRIKTTIEVK